VLGPEVVEGPNGEPIAQKNVKFIEKLLQFDAVIIAGQAKSHCVAWTIDDLLQDIYVRDERLAEKVYLLEDCTSPVVVPGVMDYTDEAHAAFQRFADAGMHVVHSTEPIANWPGIRLSTPSQPSPTRGRAGWGWDVAIQRKQTHNEKEHTDDPEDCPFDPTCSL
jgi:hypothetical protein